MSDTSGLTAAAWRRAVTVGPDGLALILTRTGQDVYRARCTDGQTFGPGSARDVASQIDWHVQAFHR